MRSFSMCFLLCLLILVIGARAGSAQQVQPLDPEWLQKMYAEGWEKVQEGVLQRDTGDGQYETFSYGSEGLQWVLEGYEEQKAFFESRHGENPTPELARVIEDLGRRIDTLRVSILQAPVAESFAGEEITECTDYSMGLSAHAYPQETPRGVRAVSAASFNSNCPGMVADTFAVAHAEAFDANGDIQYLTYESPRSSGTAISSQAAASMAGIAGCYSWAEASVTINQYTVYTTPRAENYRCPPGVTVSLNAPFVVTTDAYTSPCQDVSWTASANGGTSPYTFDWYIDSSFAGSGPTLTKRYCETDATLAIKVVARDANGWTAERTAQTVLQHIGLLSATASGPSQVTTNSTTPCVNVTWTANATEGHPGYTYQWYTGTGTTAEGTGSTFIKQYCRTNGTVTVRVVASDSDGHTAEATTETLFTHIDPPLTATVNGPSSVDSTPCVDVTWTASAQGGHPGYTYQWYIGIGSPEVGTGSSYTKRFCNTTETVTVRVIVRDSDGHTVEATKQAQITGALDVTISGPGTVTYDYYTSTCTDVTWTASVTGGSPAFTYKWYIGSGTTVQGTSATFTKRYCETNGSLSVRVVVTDSRSSTDEATFTGTTLRYRAPIVASISAPSSVSTNTTPVCMDVTWTASATSSGGNHSGFTYSWYIGTTLQGSGSTLTKRYCSVQSVTMRLVAKASDNHTDEDTRTSTVGPASPTPTISGPTEVYLGFQCQGVTWTVNTTGGTSPYTYSWYIGTTLVGSGTSYAANYCRTNQTVNLKVVARDSAGKTGEDLHTTYFYYEDPYSCVVEEDPDSSNTNAPINPCN